MSRVADFMAAFPDPDSEPAVAASSTCDAPNVEPTSSADLVHQVLLDGSDAKFTTWLDIEGHEVNVWLRKGYKVRSLSRDPADAAAAVPKHATPVAYMRRWAFDGETPAKERNASGRLVWPDKFKLVPVTQIQVRRDDVALVAADSANAVAATGANDDTRRLEFLLDLSGRSFELIDRKQCLLDARGRIVGQGSTKREAIDAAMGIESRSPSKQSAPALGDAGVST